MKKIRLLIIISCLFYLFNVKNVFAECDIETRTNAANVSVNYDMERVPIDGYGQKHPEIDVQETLENINDPYEVATFVHLNIQNVTDRIYITVNNKTEGSFETYNYADTDNGNILIEIPDTEIIREFEIKVYSKINDCLNEELRTININTPKLNEYYYSSMCANNDAFYCRNEFITNDFNVDENEIYEMYSKSQLEKEKNDKQNGNQNENNNFFESNKKWFYVSGLVVIAFLVIAIIVVIVKKIKKNRKYRS